VAQGVASSTAQLPPVAPERAEGLCPMRFEATWIRTSDSLGWGVPCQACWDARNGLVAPMMRRFPYRYSWTPITMNQIAVKMAPKMVKRPRR
jgi:hypothetical protein